MALDRVLAEVAMLVGAALMASSADPFITGLIQMATPNQAAVPILHIPPAAALKVGDGYVVYIVIVNDADSEVSIRLVQIGNLTVRLNHNVGPGSRSVIRLSVGDVGDMGFITYCLTERPHCRVSRFSIRIFR